MKHIYATVALIAATLLSATTNAAMIKLAASGTVVAVENAGGSLPLDTSIGQFYVATWLLDVNPTASGERNELDGESGQAFLAVLHASLTVGDSTFDLVPVSFDFDRVTLVNRGPISLVRNRLNPDGSRFDSWTVLANNSNAGGTIAATLIGPAGTLTSLDYFVPADLAGWSADFSYFALDGACCDYLRGSLDRWSVTVVPEPGTLWLLLAGLGIMGIVGRTRARMPLGATE